MRHLYWKVVSSLFVKGGFRRVVEMHIYHDLTTGTEEWTGEIRAEMIPIAARNVS